MRLLIVDDNSVDSALAVSLCRRRWPGLEATCVTSGADAMQRLRQQQFDAILLDYLLPDMDGLTWLRQSAPLRRKAPVVMLTWHGDEKLAVSAITSGAEEYVPKEDVPQLLTVTIERAMRQRHVLDRVEHLRREVFTQNQHRRDIIDSVPMILYSTDCDLNILEVNEEFRRAARCNGAADLARDSRIVGRNLLEFISPGPLRERYGKLLRDVLRTGEPHQECIVDATPEGEIHCQLIVQPIRDGNAIRGLIFCCQDVTDRVRQVELEVKSQRLSERNRQLVELEKFKSQFLANISHDLRTPLTAIRAYCEMCLDFNNLDKSEIRSNLQVIRDQAERLGNMISNLLDLSQMEANRHHWRMESVELQRVAGQLRQVFEPIAAAQGLELHVDLDAQTPALQADAQGLTRVLENLVGNAMKFTPAGAIEVRIEPWHNQVPLGESIRWNGTPAVLFSVEDTGIGMSAQDCRMLFGRRNHHQHEQSGRGFGLGLLICREIVQQHGGQIWATSQAGSGSRFNVLWPTTQTSREESKAPLPTRNQTRAASAEVVREDCPSPGRCPDG